MLFRYPFLGTCLEDVFLMVLVPMGFLMLFLDYLHFKNGFCCLAKFEIGLILSYLGLTIISEDRN